MDPHLDEASIRAIANEVASLLDRTTAEDRALLTAGQVAARFNVDRSWVYAHADELGVVRLGLGARPRLRFDPAVVAQHLLARAPSAPPPRRFHRPSDVSLLPVKPTRPRRNLG